MSLALALILYPGLALTVGLALLLRLIAEGRPGALALPAAPWRSADSMMAVLSLALAALGLALIPWPLHPAAGSPLVGSPLLIWAAFEGAFLAPLLPALLAPSPLAVRAASREAQLGVAGRCVVWMAIGVALWAGASWEPAALPGRALAALGGLLAVPAAGGLGPFGAERSLSPAAAEEGLDGATAALVRFARGARAAALLAALIVASLPLHLIAPPIALTIALAVFILAALLAGRARGLPRFTLPGGLRWCLWRAMPLAVAGLVYVIVV